MRFIKWDTQKIAYAAFLLGLFSLSPLPKADASGLTAAVPEQRVAANTGAIFTRDTSNPALGEAYRDPSGLIWGAVLKAQGKTKKVFEYEAKNYCKDAGGRLPKYSEFKQLAKYLGADSANGWSPYLADGKTEVFPGLSKNDWFWSSYDGTPDDSSIPFSFYGFDPNHHDYDFAVRCVSDR